MNFYRPIFSAKFKSGEYPDLKYWALKEIKLCTWAIQ